MNPSLAFGFKSRSQIARVLTEDWGVRNLYCPACDVNTLVQSSANTRAFDYSCHGCNGGYQLKAGTRWSEKRVPDAGYESMVGAIRSERVPNLFVMQYTADWRVLNLLLVPSFFFTESAIQKRNPLSPTARRAGWIGCNILLSAIAPEGKLRLIAAGVPQSPTFVRQQYRKVRPLAELKVSKRGWTLDVLKFVHRIGRTRFALQEMYAFEPEFAKLYPKNRNIRPKIRQQLQVLRDFGFIDFFGSGEYGLRS
jgi:type II restriction enzyme